MSIYKSGDFVPAMRRSTRSATQQRVIEDNKTRPIAPAQQKETVSDWIQTWLRVYAPERCQPKTLERYIGLANYIVKATEGEPAKLAATPIDQIDHRIVESALRSLLHAKAKRREHLSPKTIREIAGVLSVSLNEAFRLEKIVINPLSRVKLPRVVRSDALLSASEEIQRLREACSGDWTFTIVELALATGARRGELLALTWHDVDWLNSRLSINKSLEETRSGLRVKSPKNGRSRRFAVGQSAIAALRFLQAQQAEHRRLCGAGYQEFDLVLCQPNGEYLHPDLVSQVICRRMKKAGIRDASLHTLRHTHASNLLPERYHCRQYRNASATPMQTLPLGFIRMHCRKMMYSRPTAGRKNDTRSHSVSFWRIMAHQTGRQALTKRRTELKTKGKELVALTGIEPYFSLERAAC